MAKIVFNMLQSLDGYVDHTLFAPAPDLFRHFVRQTEGLAGGVYGRKMYETMVYWDVDDPDWGEDEHRFATAFRKVPKWVVSQTLTSVGHNATLIGDDFADVVRKLKAESDGTIEVAGPMLAQSLTDLGLIDEYHIYLQPVVAGHGKPFFAGPTPPLRLASNDLVAENVVRLTYVPA